MFAIVTLLALYLINLYVLHVGTDHYQKVVRDAAADGSLAKELPLALGHRTPRYAHEVNDCLTFSMLVYPRTERPWVKPISSPVPDRGIAVLPADALLAKGYPFPGHCSDLYLYLHRPKDVPFSAHYHRYLHGHYSFIGLLLAFLSLKTATTLCVLLACGLLVFLIFVALLRTRKHRRASQPFGRDLAFAVLALYLLFFSGIYPFAYSLNLADAYLLVWIFLILSYFRPLCRIEERNFVMLALAFGCLTIFIEMNTGEIAIGVIALLLALVFGEATDGKTLVRRGVLGTFSFLLAVVLCLALKMLVVTAIWGRQELAVFQTTLAVRMGSGDIVSNLTPRELYFFTRIGVDPSLVERSRIVSSAYSLFKSFYASFALYYGSAAVGLLVTTTSWLAAIATNWRAMWTDVSPLVRSASALLLAASMVAPVWYVIFPNATTLHTFYFARPLAWMPPIFLLGVIYRWQARTSARAAATGSQTVSAAN